MLQLPDHITKFMSQFKKAGHQIYLVGGAVRDLLLNKDVKEWDFTTSATPEEILKLFPNGFYDNKFGTVGIPDKEKNLVFEVTTFRKESNYEDLRHPGQVGWAKTVEEDLSRRDFTINAIAYDGEKLVDPHQGQEDLKNKLIRAVGNPDERFREDALRLMRAIRFAAQFSFLIEEATRKAIERDAQLITKIAWERIREEFFKILSSDNPTEGILFLKSTGLLAGILPEVDVCFMIPQKSPKRHHVYDVGTHLVMSLKNCASDDVIVRFATLLHDIGKATTFRRDETGLITFYNHEVVGTQMTEQIADRFKLSNKEKEKLVTLVKYHQFTVTELQTDKAVRRFIREVGKEYIEDMLILRTADRIGSGATPTSWRLELFKTRIEEVQKEPFKVTDLKIDGRDVMEKLNIKPGPQVGEVLKKLFDDVVEGKVKNEREDLLEVLKSK